MRPEDEGARKLGPMTEDESREYRTLGHGNGVFKSTQSAREWFDYWSSRGVAFVFAVLDSEDDKIRFMGAGTREDQKRVVAWCAEWLDSEPDQHIIDRLLP